MSWFWMWFWRPVAEFLGVFALAAMVLCAVVVWLVVADWLKRERA